MPGKLMLEERVLHDSSLEIVVPSSEDQIKAIKDRYQVAEEGLLRLKHRVARSGRGDPKCWGRECFRFGG